VPRASFITFGCKVNQYDTQAMRETLREAGYDVVPPNAGADLYVVNTCDVTSMADAKARQAIRKVHRLRPGSRILVTGCYAERSREELLQIEGVTTVFGNREKFAFREVLRESERVERMERLAVGDADAPVDLGEFGLSVASFDEHTRALVKVQDGCSAYCSYCVIPYVRGRMRSRALPAIADEVRRLADRGFREVVITGVHLGAYGRDIRRRWTLVDVLEAVHAIEGVWRIRLSSIEPMDVPTALIRAVAELPKCARHFHLPLQSGSADVLRRMRRRYTPGRFLELVDELRTTMPDVGLTTDVMVGFPGETDADFMETRRVVEKSGFHRLHVFRYSPREGTPAASFADPVPPEVAIRRSDELRSVGRRLMRRYQERFVGQIVEVMIEDQREGRRNELAGYAGNYLRVLTDADDGHTGTLQRVELFGYEESWMRGRIVGVATL
jgi:threonylcarbamoyladenosine tRNA methylthiotransferase MtaB